MLITVNSTKDGQVNVQYFSGTKANPKALIGWDTQVIKPVSLITTAVDIFINNDNRNMEEVIQVLKSTIKELQGRGKIG